MWRTVLPEPHFLFRSSGTRYLSRPNSTADLNCRDVAAGSDAGAGTCEHLLRSSCCQERSPKWSGGGAGTASTPEMAGEERSAEDKRSPQLDIYGRRLDRSFRMQEEVQEPIEVKECDNIIADVSSGDDQHKRVDGGSIPAGRVGCAEPRAEAAEAAAREAATAAVTAVCETRVAKDETERLRAEVVELSRWREAVLNLRDKLDIDQRDEQGGGGDGSGERRTNEDGGCFLHCDLKCWACWGFRLCSEPKCHC